MFCNVSAATLAHPATFAQCLDFLEANRALAPSFVLEFKQSTFRNLGPTETEHLAALFAARLPFLDRPCQRSPGRAARTRRPRRPLHQGAGVAAARSPAELDIGYPPLRFVRSARPLRAINLIAEKIEGERAVVDLLDFDVRFGQGFLFAPPRPLQPEGASATGGTTSKFYLSPQWFQCSQPPPCSTASQPVEPATRATGNAALARRAAGPG